MKRIVIVLISTIVVKLILDVIIRTETYDNAMIKIIILSVVFIVGMVIASAYNTQKIKKEEEERNEKRRAERRLKYEKKEAEEKDETT